MYFPRQNHNKKDGLKKPGDFVILKQNEEILKDGNTETVIPQQTYSKIKQDINSTDDLLKVLKDGIPKRNPSAMQVITITDDTSKKDLDKERRKEESIMAETKKQTQLQNKRNAVGQETLEEVSK